MNVYDFDGTLYRGDSSCDFVLYAFRKHPSLLRFFPRIVWGFLRYSFRTISKTEMKERFFSFLSAVDGEALAGQFWETHADRIRSWYPEQHREDDLVISASPEFLLRPICSRLGITRLMASRVDPRTGRFEGGNCRDTEKVRRFREQYGDAVIDSFYSDSSADLPLAKMAKKAFLVHRNGRAEPWEQKRGA